MIEKWRQSLDSDRKVAAVLTDLSRAFGSIDHELLIGKLNAHGFDDLSLNFIYSYFSGRKQRTKTLIYLTYI